MRERRVVGAQQEPANHGGLSLRRLLGAGLVLVFHVERWERTQACICALPDPPRRLSDMSQHARPLRRRSSRPAASRANLHHYAVTNL